MADRSVVVFLRANIAGFQAGMRRAGLATRDFANQAERNALRHRQAWDSVGKGMLLTGGLIAVGVGYAVKANTEFEKQLSALRAVTNAGAGDMDKFRKSALKAGKDTAFSATEAAKAQTELGKVGISTSDILGGALSGSLSLAAAGQIDLADAATISGQAMKIFGLQGKDVGHIADVLSAGANKSAADVGQLGQALQQGGLVASQTGLHLEDTVGVLSAFADNALMGSDAGTSLKTMLQRLTPQSAQAADLMKKLGLSAYDSSGNFVGMANYAQQLQDKLGGMSAEQRNAAMQTLFGSDAVRGANILYKLGAKGIQEYTGAVNDQGAASRTAAIQMDNLAGDLEQLKGTIETIAIQGGSGANAGLRGAVKNVNSLATAYAGLPEPIQHAAFDITALTGVTLLMGGAFISAVPKIAATRASLAAAGLTAAKTKAAFAAVSPALAVVGVAAASEAVGGLVGKMQVANVSTKHLAADLQALGSGGKLSGAGLSIFSTKLGPFHNNVSSSSDALQRFGNDAYNALDQGWDARLGRWQRMGSAQSKFKDETSQLDRAFASMVQHGNADQASTSFDKFAQAAVNAGVPLSVIRKQFPQYVAALDQAGPASKNAADGSTNLASGLQKVGDKAQGAGVDIDGLKRKLDQFNGINLTARGAARAYEQAIDDATDALKHNGRTLDITSPKGRENAAALDGIAESANASAKAILDQTGSESAMRGSMTKSRAALVATAIKFGMSKAAANDYADKVLRIPKTAPTKAKFDHSAASAGITALKNQLASLPLQRRVNVLYRTSYRGQVGATPALRAPASPYQRARGGPVNGPGTGTSDSIPAMLSNGEYVVKASSVKRIGVSRLNALNAVGYAEGGAVGFTEADFSSITGRIPSSAPTRGDIADLRMRETKATRALVNAEEALWKVRHSKHHTDRDVARAERAVANARDSVSTSTGRLRKAEQQRRAASRPYATRFHKAANASSRQTEAFLRDVATLRKWGYNGLADQLLQQGDDDAARLAHQAVSRRSVARTVNADVSRSARDQGRLQAAQAAVQARVDARTAAAEKAATLTNYASTTSSSVRNTAAFLANVQTLANRGFAALASSLLQQNDEDAETTAAQAVKASAVVVSKLNADITTQAAQETKRQSMIDALNGATPTAAWSLPAALSAPSYGARPSTRTQLQTIQVFIGGEKIDERVSANVDGAMAQIASGMIYGG